MDGGVTPSASASWPSVRGPPNTSTDSAERRVLLVPRAASSRWRRRRRWMAELLRRIATWAASGGGAAGVGDRPRPSCRDLHRLGIGGVALVLGLPLLAHARIFVAPTNDVQSEEPMTEPAPAAARCHRPPATAPAVDALVAADPALAAVARRRRRLRADAGALPRRRATVAALLARGPAAGRVRGGRVRARTRCWRPSWRPTRTRRGRGRRTGSRRSTSRRSSGGRRWRGCCSTRAPTRTPSRATRWRCGRSTAPSRAGRARSPWRSSPPARTRTPRQRHGWTPLHGAADNGLADVVEALLAAGADPRSHER